MGMEGRPVIVSRDPHLPLTLGQREELERAYPEAQRLLAAIKLARDLDACADLLAGRPVDSARLDQAELASAKRRTLVRLVAPADLLEAEAA